MLAIILPILFALAFIPFSQNKTTIIVYLIFSVIGNAISSILLSISMTIGGGALDNAKKLVEANFPKGHDARKAAVIGDTFGDPIKDTSGPSLIASLRIFLLFSLCFFYKMGGSILN
jgi:K(+)-stimulated pyrophosphate-energized sodium pump